MCEIVSAGFAVERLKVLAGEILEVAKALRERHPAHSWALPSAGAWGAAYLEETQPSPSP